MRGTERRCATLGLAATLGIGLLALAASETQAQRRQKAPPAVAKEAPHTQMQEVKREQQPGARESVQADVSARNVSVTSSFNGIEIVIFGAVDNSQQPSAESGYYDVMIVVEGVPGRIVVRRKNNVAGLWLNTSSATFDVVPSYYAIASTRPIDEITSEDFRASHGVGFQHACDRRRARRRRDAHPRRRHEWTQRLATAARLCVRPGALFDRQGNYHAGFGSTCFAQDSIRQRISHGRQRAG